MARIAGARVNEVAEEIFGQAIDNAADAMDMVVIKARQKLKAGITQMPPIVREGHFATAKVSFTPKTGKNKGELVEFQTDKRWTGRRTPDNLMDSIRRVDSEKKKLGSIRVYAGNFKVYWAFMVEKGYHDRSGKYHPGLHFLQGAFLELKKRIVDVIGKGI